MTKRKVKLACPGCGKPVSMEQPEFPFCSDRCRTLDLGKWADAAYVVSTPLTAADLMGDADYTVSAVERVPASSVEHERESLKAESEALDSQKKTTEHEQRGSGAGEGKKRLQNTEQQGETSKQQHRK